jgi:hypothetical protein
VVDHLAALAQDHQFLTNKQQLLDACQSKDSTHQAQERPDLDKTIAEQHRKIDRFFDGMIS